MVVVVQLVLGGAGGKLGIGEDFPDQVRVATHQGFERPWLRW
jgi:hypothetical protein